MNFMQKSYKNLTKIIQKIYNILWIFYGKIMGKQNSKTTKQIHKKNLENT